MGKKLLDGLFVAAVCLFLLHGLVYFGVGLWRWCRARRGGVQPAAGSLRELDNLRTLFATVVHDLRNPLSAAAMHLQLLRQRLEALPVVREPGNILPTLAAVERAHDRAQHLTDALYDYIRSLSGQLLLQVEPEVDLAALVWDLLDEQGPLLGERAVQVQIEPNLPRLAVDGARLSQVLVNLLDNVRKHTPAQTTVAIRARQLDAAEATRLPCGLPPRPGPWVLLTVADNGPGIPEAERAHLFMPFHGLQRERGRRDGLGLGLYLSRCICEAHGGRMWAESGPGASLCILLPASGNGMQR